MTDMTPQQRSEIIAKKNRQVLKQLRSGAISFQDVLTLSDTSEFSGLNNVKMSRLLSRMPGWTPESIRRAMITYGVPDIKLSSVKKSEKYMDAFNHLMLSTPTTYQRRVEAPEGWPWFGNVVSTMHKLEGVKLPKEIQETTRFLLDDEKEGKTYASSHFASIDDLDDIHNTIDDNDSLDSDDDFLDTMLGDDTDDNYDDGLQDLFGDV